MQYVNDDMDELFRKAAEDYPLDTTSADWSKVAAALQGEAAPEVNSENKKNKNRHLFWLLLLLPLGLICNQLYSPGVLNVGEVSKEMNAHKKMTVNLNRDKKNTDSDPDFNNSNRTVPTVGSTRIERKASAENRASGTLKSSEDALGTSLLDDSKRSEKNYLADGRVQSKNQIISNETETDLSVNKGEYSRKYVSAISLPHILKDDVSSSVTKRLDPLFSPSEEKSKPIHIERRKRFYAGVVGGVDATTIKFQKIENAGATYGALFGYNFHKKWSIESGFLLEKKYYYTEGKYFNTSKLPIPSSWQIDNVSGNCKMIEIPVSLKYTLAVRKNSSWFGTVGVSSFFMKNQDYTYDYYYSNWGPYTRHIPYDTSSTYIFSNIGFSIGYSHRLGNFAGMRIEPYVKLPVSGIGVGSLPMFSTGLQIGITRKF